jgi:hypothetical protein
MSCRISGLRVTIPLPRGRKSRPTIFSRTEDLPEDCEPTTTLGRDQCQVEGRQGGHSYNLREVQTVIADSVKNQILQFIDYSKQILTKRCHLAVLGESR